MEYRVAEMKHHWADFLDRDDGLWSMAPNRERYAHRLGSVSPGETSIRILTFGRGDLDWERALQFPLLEEVTLHEPLPEQVAAVCGIKTLRRLRISHSKLRNIEVLAEASGLEEIVLEYVSGFEDLGPLSNLSSLRALHLENLRRVEDFSGLVGAGALRYLSIDGTLDWKQPIRDFEFLRGLANLEVLRLANVRNLSRYPALAPVLALKRLRKIRLHPHMFPTEEYALLSVGLSGVTGFDWECCRRFAYAHLPVPEDDERATLPLEQLSIRHPEVRIIAQGRRVIADPDSEWFEFIGKSAGRVKCTSPAAHEKCRRFREQFEAMRGAARALIAAQAW